MSDYGEDDSDFAGEFSDAICTPTPVGSAGGSSMISLIECPVCYEHILPPILQCCNGHLICEMCHSRLSACPLCNIEFKYIRNLAMEQMAMRMLFPCKYVSNGCAAILPYAGKLRHDMACPYRPYMCPFLAAPICHWEGSLAEVKQHLLAAHATVLHYDGAETVFKAVDVSAAGTKNWAMLMSCFGHSFLLMLKKVELSGDTQTLHMVLKLLGTSVEADKFMYLLSIEGADRRLIYTANTLSIQSEMTSAIDNLYGLCFEGNLKQFLVENRLEVDVKIKERLSVGESFDVC